MMLSLDCAIELTIGRVTLEHVDHVVEGNEGVMSTFPELKKALVTRCAIQLNLFILTFTIVSQA